MRYIVRYIPDVIYVLILSSLVSCTQNREITVRELKNHIAYLASDSLKGRQTGTPGDSLASEYIKNELASYGFKPLTEDGFQRFMVTTGLVAGTDNSFIMNDIAYSIGKDFTPFAFSSDASHESEVIFAGFGFNINTDSLVWNDYKNIDVKGKWVLVLRDDPESGNPMSRFVNYNGDRDKALVAKDMGAAGIMMVSGSASDPGDSFESPDPASYSAGIPAFRIKRELADRILERSKKNIDGLEKQLSGSAKPFSFATGTIISATGSIKREMHTARNVVMVLPGEDEALKNEYVILGAHYDHLGMGGPGSSSRSGDTVAVHPGADDNASGVGLMLEIAEKFALTKGSHKRSIICLAFSGEEMGLLGSKYFVENQVIDPSTVNIMINLDMVGRLNDDNVLQVSGAGTAAGLKDLVRSGIDTSRITLTISDQGYGPSDHSSFYGKDIPVLFYSTGAHLDYHTPSDTYNRIDYEGVVTISSFISGITEKLASSPERLVFRESGPKTLPKGQMRRKGVTLGIMPDFAGNIKNGLRADFVTPGKPGALGGMKKGDIITSINGMTVNNIEDYMFRMNGLKYGETISVEILRDNQKMVLLIQL